MLRKTRDGVVLGGRHRLSLEAALFAHTVDAAFAVGLEDRIGSVEPGKAADLTWLASDLRDISAEEIAEVAEWSHPCWTAWPTPIDLLSEQLRRAAP